MNTIMYKEKKTMNRIFAFIMSIIFAIMSALGIVIPGDNGDYITQGPWIAIVVEELGLQPSSEDIELPFDYIPAEYVEALEVAYYHGIIEDDDDIFTGAYATNSFVYATLTRGANGEAVNFPSNFKRASFANAYKALLELKTALNNKEIDENAPAVFTAQAGVINLSDITDYIVSGDQLIYDADDFNLEAGDIFIAGMNKFNPTGAAYNVVAVNVADGLAYVDVAAVEIQDAVEEMDFEATLDADLNKAVAYDQNGELISDGTDTGAEVAEQGVIKDKVNEVIDDVKEEIRDFIRNPEISFSIGDLDIEAAYSGGQVDIGLSGEVTDGVGIEKYYSINNIHFDTKFDANLSQLQINEAYIKMDYSLVETTALTGSYAASVVPEGVEYGEDDTFLDKVKANLESLTLKEGGGIKVNVFTFEIPVGSTGLIIEMNISLTISASGRIEIVVTSNEVKGYEIINNKGRYISESTILDRRYNVYGDFQVVLGLDLALSFLGYKIVDVAFQGGIGAYVTTHVFNIKTNSKITFEIPFDIMIESVSSSDDIGEVRICANVQLYGILRISVCEDSILDEIGLSNSWTIFDRSNAVFAELHIENEGIVDQCSYNYAA